MWFGRVSKALHKDCSTYNYSFMENMESKNSMPSFKVTKSTNEVMDPSSFGNTELSQILDVCNIINNSVCTVAQTVQYIADIKVQIKELDAQLEAFLAQTSANLERFKTAMPVLEGQLNNISNRLDRITDSILTQTQNSEMSEDLMKKHSMMLDLLESTNNSFNNMLMRILAL